jgi:hypothetical protein
MGVGGCLSDSNGKIRGKQHRRDDRGKESSKLTELFFNIPLANIAQQIMECLRTLEPLFLGIRLRETQDISEDSSQRPILRAY